MSEYSTIFEIIRNKLIDTSPEEKQRILPFQIESDADTKIFSGSHGHTQIDQLHESYINDVSINYQVFNETQQLNVDVWKFVEDTSVTTDKPSGASYEYESGGSSMFYDSMLLDNNVGREQKPSESVYEKNNFKILWNESEKQQTDVQLQSNLQLIYLYGVYPNLEHITPGDIIKDPIATGDFWIVSNTTQSKEYFDKINQLKIIVVTLNVSRYNITRLPEQIKEYYGIDINNL